MKLFNRPQTLILATLLFLAPTLVAAQGPGHPIRLSDADWQEVAPHVFQRSLEEAGLETVGWGREALVWELEQVRARIADLENLSSGTDGASPALLDALSEQRSLAIELEAELRGAPEAPASSAAEAGGLQSLAAALGCTLVITTNANAHPTTTGPAANATAAFSDTCPTSGQVRATAYAQGYENGAFRYNSESDPGSGRRNGVGSASASASASVVASENCASQGVARVWIVASNGEKVPFVYSAGNTKCRITLPDPCSPFSLICL